MSSTLTIILTLVFGLIIFLIYGKKNIKEIAVPLILLLAGDFLLLYAKFAAGDPLMSFLLPVPAFILLFISVVWIVVVVIKRETINKDKRKMAAILLFVIASIVIAFLPTLSREDKFNIYQEDFNAVSDAVFQAYDESKLAVGEQFSSPPYSTSDLDRLRSVFSEDVIRKMKKLNRSAGVYTYIAADEDVVYFSYGAVFQSISGVAIVRNGKDPSKDEELKSRFFDGAIRYEPIGDNAYHFNDGL